MADKVVPWSGSPSDRAGDVRRPGDGSAAFLDAEQIVSELPETFREPARELAIHLGVAGAWGPSDADAGSKQKVKWYESLTPQESWAVIGAFRRSIDAAPESASLPLSPSELHTALDRQLLDVMSEAVSGTAAAYRRVLEDVSHDIRSPLNSILFLADALQAERSGSLNKIQTRQMAVLYTAAVTLVGLINDLIDFARLGGRERIHVAESSFSVESVLDNVGGLLGPMVAHYDVSIGIDVHTEGPRTGDAQLLNRVLLNLISNAVQAVDEGGQVSVRVDESPRGDLLIEVSDSREDTDVERLRARISEAAMDEIPGETRGWTRGLGLSISARLVKAAAGRLEVSSRPGEGTVFSLELPFRRL